MIFTVHSSVSAAVMSSVDSSLLSGATYLSHNLLGMANAFTFRLTTLLLGCIAVGLTFTSSSVYGLWALAADLGYALVFPQFCLAVHAKDKVNALGSVASAGVALALRIMVGEPLIGLPPIITTPKHESDGSEVLPVKSLIMLASLATLVGTSALWRRLRAHN